MGYFAAARRVLWLAFGLLMPLLPAWGILEHGGTKADISATSETARVVSAHGGRATPFGAPRSFGLSGRVMDPYGDPISDAEIWLENMGADGGTSAPVWLGTDADGLFNAPQAQSGLYTVTVAARGFVARAVAVELDADVTALDFTLVPAPSPRAVVVDPEGRPVSDATVVACPQGAEATLRSAADGTVVFGSGAIGCSATAHHPRFSRSAPVRLRSEGPAILRLERGGAIEGVVTDPSGRALFDCEISLSTFEPSEGEQPLADSLFDLRVSLGREFRFSGLAPGTYTLVVLRHVRIEDSETTEVLATSTFEVASGRVVRGVHIVADPNEVLAMEAPSPLRWRHR